MSLSPQYVLSITPIELACKTPYGICAKTTGNVRLRQGASTLTASLAVVPKGTPIIICAHNASWHKCTAFIGGKCVVGYMSTKYVKEVK